MLKARPLEPHHQDAVPRRSVSIGGAFSPLALVVASLFA
jgi:hypothetical protein